MNCHWCVSLTVLKTCSIRCSLSSLLIGGALQRRYDLWVFISISVSDMLLLSHSHILDHFPTGSRWTYQPSRGPLCSLRERQQDAHERAGNESSLHETKTQYSQGWMLVNRPDFKVIMLPEVGCFIAFTGILQRPTGATDSPLPNDARRALRDGG